MTSSKIVTVFGSGQVEPVSREYQDAFALGKLLGQNGYTVCNGGYGGIMEASARGAKEAGGNTLGITTAEFSAQANAWMDRVQIAPTWRERLFRLIEQGDAYIVCDGGTGTFTELFVVWEMTNKKLIQKPILIAGSFCKKALDFISGHKLVQTNAYLKQIKNMEEVLQYLPK